MLWDEIYVERRLEDHEARRLIAVAFGIPEDCVAVVGDIGASTLQPGTLLTVELRRWPGDFPQRVGLYFENGANPPTDMAAARTRLLGELDCRALASDDSLDPYRFELLHPNGQTEIVYVDPDALDAKDALRIKERPEVNKVQPGRRRVRNALDYYTERSVMLVPETPDQEASLRLLDATIARLHRSRSSPTKEQLDGLRAAMESVVRTWPPEQVAQVGGSLHSLLAAAELILNGDLD